MLTLALIILTAGEPNDWNNYGSKPAKGAKAAASKSKDSGVPQAAQARYQDAVAKLTARQYGPANDVLNALAGEFPHVPEIYASRCSAQLGLQHWAAAEADCDYTLKLKPLPTAVYGLAVAEDGQGKLDLAIAHYRQYSALPDATAQLRQQANARAELLLGQSGVAPAPPPPPAKGTVVAAKQPEPAKQPDVAPAPPPPGGGKGQFVPGIPDPGEGLLYVYRNIPTGSGTAATLFVDNVRIGELWNERYFEVRVKAGRHSVAIKAKNESALDVETNEGEITYVKLEGNDSGFNAVTVGKEGRKEIRSACELVASKKL